ncbi:hypothetical protein ACJMK2_005369 [Sinanodonta woodiana]|uniref:Uncharacterized protein n=1 Tax=Sinanodonta woodiana TaxID=1069815 RepID=A0ABD3VPW6_SINWO
MMSSTSSDESLSLSAAGRNFQLGMVYDANTNKLFESLNVRNKCLKVVKKSRLCPSQILELKSSYTIDERMEVFQLDGHMKVGVAFGFLKLGSASGKYVNDMSSSIGQSRMTLQYKETKRYEELDTATVLKLCENLELLKMARDQGATHFVAGMTYGNQVLMDFKCTKQREKYDDLLDIQLRGIIFNRQFSADKFNKDNERIITFDDIQCEVFCESKDIKNPTSFNEAKQIYQDLPTTLQNVEAVECVHLLPLSVIDKDAKKFNKSHIDEVVMKKLVHIRDDLYEHEMLCDDSGKGKINVSKIKADIQNYTKAMKERLSSTMHKDWNREIVKYNSSDFERIQLRKRIREEFRPITDDAKSGSNTVTSVAVGAVTGAASGAATGAIAGAVALGPVGAVIGGTVGGAYGAVSGAFIGYIGSDRQ